MVNEACASEAGDTEASEASLAPSASPAAEDAAKDPPEAAAAGEELAEHAGGVELVVITA